MIALNEMAGGIPIYQLKITLDDSKPPIWRRVLVRANMKLHRLHNVLQITMGWTDSHLHQFIVKSGANIVYYGMPDPDFMPGWGSETLNEKRFVISDLLSAPKQKMKYEYDFGDGWSHQIVLEKILPPDASFKHPVCVAGANACPPEDCGGVWGYYDHFLEAINDPNHEEHQSMKDWIGRDKWDASEFDLAEVNACLKRLKA